LPPLLALSRVPARCVEAAHFALCVEAARFALGGPLNAL